MTWTVEMLSPKTRNANKGPRRVEIENTRMALTAPISLNAPTESNVIAVKITARVAISGSEVRGAAKDEESRRKSVVTPPPINPLNFATIEMLMR